VGEAWAKAEGCTRVVRLSVREAWAKAEG